MTIAVLPYLLEASVDRSPGRASAALPTELPTELPTGSRIVIGLLAGLGIALKPHFFLLWLAIETDLYLQHRSLARTLRLESAIILGTQIGYALLILVQGDYLAFAGLFLPAYYHLRVDRVELLQVLAWPQWKLLMPNGFQSYSVALVVALFDRRKGPWSPLVRRLLVGASARLPRAHGDRVRRHARFPDLLGDPGGREAEASGSPPAG